MLERTDAITNEVLEPITFVLAYPTVYIIYNKTHKETASPHIYTEETQLLAMVTVIYVSGIRVGVIAA
jgi:hypothetical protein